MPQADQSAPRRSVLFVIAEDWFFVSHFLSLAVVVRKQGFDVGVLTRVNTPALRSRIEDSGIRVIAADFQRAGSGIAGFFKQIWQLRAVVRVESPDILHLISLRMIVLGGLAAWGRHGPIRVQALTGLGLVGASQGWKSRTVIALIGWVLRGPLGGRRVAYLFENRDDPDRLGLLSAQTRSLIVGGAGIDPAQESVLPLPASPPLKIAVVSRMIRSKGIAVAAEALQQARATGADVTMTLVGAPDRGNPRTLTDQDLSTLGGAPGLVWIGRTEDVRAVWRDHHVVCVPSLGGEGLPRSLLEGAAAGRPVVTTDTPGCATFVRDGVEGFVVPPGDATALAEAFVRLASDRVLVTTMGAAARRRVLDGFTIEAVSGGVIGLYRDLLSAEP